MNESAQAELKKVKLNAKNIHSVLVNRNKNKKRISASIKREEENQEQRKKLGREEKQLESPVGTSLDNIKDSVRPSDDEGGGGNIFNKLFEFLGLMLAGIIVNALPGIIEKVKEFIDGVTSFFAPIESAFKIIIGFITGQDIGSSEYDADKKRVDDSFKKLNDKGGLVEKMISAINPIVGLTARLMGVLNKGENKKGTVLAKQNEKEGFLNKDTGKFTVKQWTTAEREEYESTKDSSKQNETQHPDNPSANPDRAHAAGTPGARSVAPYEPGKGNKQRKIFLHWTAGSYTTPYSAYHTVFLGDGTPVRYTPYGTDKYSHTHSANTGSIGLSIAAMGGQGVGENYFGPYPPTAKQLEALITEAARAAVDWGWSANTIDSNVRTHGEWERYAVPAGILTPPVQRWDLDKLRQSDPNIDTRKVLSAGGNELRRRIKAKFNELKSANSDSDGKGGGKRATILPIKEMGRNRLNTISQPMYEELDDEEEMSNVYIQEVNTVKTQYKYVPTPKKKSRNISPKVVSSTKLPAVWST